MTDKVGILGLGLIGRLIAEILIPRGYECYAVRRPSTEDFPEIGGRLVNSPRQLAEVSDFLLSTLPTVDAARETFAGDDGVIKGAHNRLIIIEMNTFGLAVKEELRQALEDTPAKIIDCPISGTPPIISAGKGVIMMSGIETACEQVTSMLKLVAPKTSYVGEYGNGTKLKLMINFMVGAHTLALAEGMLFGATMGLDSQTMLDIVGPSAAGSTVFDIRADIIAERKWQPCAGPSKLLWKDLDIIEDQADALGLSAPLLRVCNQYYKKVADAGRLEDECAVVFEILENETKTAVDPSTNR